MAPSILHESLGSLESRGRDSHGTLPAGPHPAKEDSSAAYTRITSLNLAAVPPDTVCKFQLSLTATALGPVDMPLFVVRSARPGPTVGITCAVHGNEVNGIAVVQQLFRDMGAGGGRASGHGASHLPASEPPLHVDCGTVVGIPVVNVPGFLASIRCFDEDSKQDLNRLMPGKHDGSAPQQYAHAVFHKVVAHLDYLVDLHTASLGRRNSLYVRADMNHPEIAAMARLMQPQVLVHIATAGSLRGCAQARGVRALTVEIGNPSVFQTPLILATYVGIRRVLASLQMCAEYAPATPTLEAMGHVHGPTAVCSRSYWIFSSTGGILRVFKDVAQRVQPGELIAEVQTIFGDVVERIQAPDYPTVVVGVEDNPVAKSGSRVIHLGVLGDVFEAAGSDGHL